MALRSLRQRLLASILTACSIALGVALVGAVLLLEREAEGAFRRTAVGVEILVGGNKGSRIDTLLSALYYVGRAPGRIAWDYYEELEADPRVEYAIPLAVGDTYRGFPIVGIGEEFFTRFHPRPGVPLVLQGSIPAGMSRFAVVGAEAARRTGLGLGDTFYPAHGGAEGHPLHEDEIFTVAAVALPTGTAHDRAIWIDIRQFLRLKGHRGLDRAEEVDAVSAILLKTKSKSPLVIEPLIKEINDGTEAQAIRPVQVVAELFDVVGDVRKILKWVGYLVIAVAAVNVSVSLYNAMASRRRETAILRALGARKRTIIAGVLLESAILCGVGALLGLALAHGGAAAAAPFVERRGGIRLEEFGLHPLEPVILLVLVGVGCLTGMLPAFRAYRVDVARGLAPVD